MARVVTYVLFFIHLEIRRVSLAGITRYLDQPWMQQMTHNATGTSWGFLDQRHYALHDRDTKFCSLFRATLEAGGIKPIQLPARSPNLNTYRSSSRLLPRRPPPLLRPIQGREDRSKAVEPLLR